ncbi:MAG: glycoside hydrolase family 16 protein [Acholeplasmataceae bacterium]|nr:MAG: glycoside hydrolase family 16 protein [Acholeplasmataceae bacterium]
MSAYRLVFEEHFRRTGAPDSDHWHIEVGDKWANQEKQCYTADPANVHIRDNRLFIISTLHEEGPCKYRSARINTRSRLHWQYGRFVIRARMPKGRGSWPAFWFLSEGHANGIRWPLCGEIDLMEYAGNHPGRIIASLHTAAFNHRTNTERTTETFVNDADTAFHDYAMEWTKDQLVFSIDGKSYARYERQHGDGEREWPFDQPFYLIINMAVGGMFGGTIVDDDFPFVLEVDSIKVYQQTDV